MQSKPQQAGNTMISDTPFTLSHDSKLDDFLAANKQWARNMNHVHPTLFPEFNGKGQQPHTLFIGCSDSRYNESCLGVLPGEVFTWKTVANICSPGDLTFKATLEFAIRCLKVNKLVVCGHSDCGGIKTCLANELEPLKENKCGHLYEYLQDISELYHEKKSELSKFPDTKTKGKFLACCNVQKQYQRVIENETVKEAIDGGLLEVYSLLYNCDSGLLETVPQN